MRRRRRRQSPTARSSPRKMGAQTAALLSAWRASQSAQSAFSAAHKRRRGSRDRRSKRRGRQRRLRAPTTSTTILTFRRRLQTPIKSTSSASLKARRAAGLSLAIRRRLTRQKSQLSSADCVLIVNKTKSLLARFAQIIAYFFFVFRRLSAALRTRT